MRGREKRLGCWRSRKRAEPEPSRTSARWTVESFARAGAVVGEDYIVCRRVDRTAFLRNVQRIAECIVHFFLIEELVAEDDQLVIVD